ncbi:hypothetical protein RFI_24466, partial [Reticulomyxa filosa]
VDGNEGEVAMRPLLSLEYVSCYKIEGANRIPMGIGQLQVLEMATDTLLFFMPGVFSYAINKQCAQKKRQAVIEDIEMFEGLLAQFSQFHAHVSLYIYIYINFFFFCMLITKNIFVLFSNEAEGKSEEKEEEEDSETSEGKPKTKAGKLIKKGVDLAKVGIKKGTITATEGIHASKEYLKKHIQTRKRVHVSETTKQRIQKAKFASVVAIKGMYTFFMEHFLFFFFAKKKKRKEEIRKFFFQKKQNKTKTYIVSNAAVAGTRAACVELSNTLVDAASKTEIGQKIQNDQSEEMKTAKEVGKVTLQGILSIYKELDAAALVLIGEVADAGADVARYKYDDEVGEVADETATIVKNSAAVSTNMGHLSLSVIAGTTTADAAIDVLSDEKEKEAIRSKKSKSDTSSISSLVQSFTKQDKK